MKKFLSILIVFSFILPSFGQAESSPSDSSDIEALLNRSPKLSVLIKSAQSALISPSDFTMGGYMIMDMLDSEMNKMGFTNSDKDSVLKHLQEKTRVGQTEEKKMLTSDTFLYLLSQKEVIDSQEERERFKSGLLQFIELAENSEIKSKLQYVYARASGTPFSLFKIMLILILLEKEKFHEKNLVELLADHLHDFYLSKLNQNELRSHQVEVWIGMAKAKAVLYLYLAEKELKDIEHLKLKLNRNTIYNITAKWKKQFPQSRFEGMKLVADFFATHRGKSIFVIGAALLSSYTHFFSNWDPRVHCISAIIIVYVIDNFIKSYESRRAEWRLNRGYFHRDYGLHFISSLNKLERLQ